MNFKIVLKVWGLILFFVGTANALPLLVSFIYDDLCHGYFLKTLLVMCFVGLVAYFFGSRTIKDNDTNKNPGEIESCLIVVGAWILVPLFSSIPFYLSGEFGSFTNSVFETVSGFSTTGASILESIEDKPRSLLFWRSFIQFLGGMGIVVLTVAILPLLGIGGMQLYSREVPGPIQDRITPRIQDTARILWMLYTALVALQTLLYIAVGLPFFESITNSFATLATGGFSIMNASIGGHNSKAVEYITALFMLIGGANFTLHYYAIKHRTVKKYFSSEEFKIYITFVVVATLIIASVLFARGAVGLEEVFRKSLFQVISILTTTGFGTDDYTAWPVSLQFVLLLLMLIGGMGGSTAGGVKVGRVAIVLRHIKREFYRIINPGKVKFFFFEEKIIENEVLLKIFAFMFLYAALVVAFTFIIILTGVDFKTSFSSVISALSSVGPALGEAGPMSNYNFFSNVAKWVMIFAMILGRLEIFTVLIIFFPSSWKKEK